MALQDYILTYTKDWKNPADFPTYETKEAKVREDMQLLFDEMRNAFNNFLVDLSAGLLPFSSSSAVPASNVQDAILNVQSQIVEASTGNIPPRSLDGDRLKEDAITEDELSEGCVTSVALAVVDAQGENGAVSSENISKGAVTGPKIADEAVNGDKIAPGSVGTNHLGQAVVTGVKIRANAVSTVYDGVLAYDAWTGSAAPYSQAVTVSGILAEDIPLIDLVPNSAYATAVQEDEQWAQIYRAVATAGTITFYAKEKPTMNLNFRARCIRK